MATNAGEINIFKRLPLETDNIYANLLVVLKCSEPCMERLLTVSYRHR